MKSGCIWCHSSVTSGYTIPYSLGPILPVARWTWTFCLNSLAHSGLNFFDGINQLVPVPYICVKGSELLGGCMSMIRHHRNHNFKSWVWQHRKVMSCVFAHALCLICCRSLVASPSFLPGLLNLPCTLLQNISIYCSQILRALSVFSPGRFQKLPKNLQLPSHSPAVHLEATSFQYLPWRIPWCFFTSNPASDTFFHSVKAL